jgi:hypothetical protein
VEPNALFYSKDMLLALPANIILGLKWLTNTLVYNKKELIVTVKVGFY